MGLLKKIKRKAKSIVRKIVPKEIAGIARAAAPFVGAKFGLPAALATSVAGQLRSGEGRINPLETVLAVAPSRGFRDFVTQKIPGGGRLDEILYGTRGQEYRDLDPTKGFGGLGSLKTTEGTRGILDMIVTGKQNL